MMYISSLIIYLFSKAGANNGSFFGIPTWYKYLDCPTYIDYSTQMETCTPQINGIADFWLIGAAILDILLRVSALLAVAYIVIAGISYIKSQGNPDQTAKAQRTLINAVAGLIIAVISAVVVNFVAGRFK